MQKLLAQKISELPARPGVYRFYDQAGLLLYVGKANKLKNRVSSYFKPDYSSNRGQRIELMISQIADLDYTVVRNEVEALVLENNFIKNLKPKYNVRMRDDKNYIFLKINAADEIPTIDYEHQRLDKSAKYFGPYTSSLAIKDTLRLLRRVFPYCANSKVTSKPCFYYHIGKCPGVCFGKISTEDYRKNYIGKIVQFLEGREQEVLQNLKSEMKIFAKSRQYEKAARVRDQIFALNRVLERQKLVYSTKVSQDVFSLHCESVAVVNLFIVREGKLIQKENFVLENTRQVPAEEILQSFLERYYLDATNLPKEILVPFLIDDTELKTVFIALDNNPSQPPLTLRGGATKTKLQPGFDLPPLILRGGASGKGSRGSYLPKISVPVKGERLKLLQLGTENAKHYLEAASDKHLLEETRLLASLRELQRVLELPALPSRMECFDISNIQGTNAVGSMVVFDYARPKKSDYRKFKIQRKNTPDDFAMMREMLARRFKHSLPSPPPERPGRAGLSPHPWPLPDLIIIDGGKGQLSAATAAISNSEFPNSKQISIIGLAKRLEEIFLPGRKDPIRLPDNSPALFLLQRIRDEAHRFAITYHRKLRSKSAVTSVLDQISGIGPAKKKKLLDKFGSAAKLKTASLTDIAEVVGSRVAEKIKASL
ncbi:MAG TPA: excinuclease ABC subunit UvrC [Patescibacteria group bacterium]|nr:excinuclease ABC subunit UvrC [Patescibacteria group bacterium]